MTLVAGKPRFEQHADGRLGIGETAPRLSWTIDSPDPGSKQKSARVEVIRELPGREPAASIAELATSEQILVPWPFDPLRSRERVSVRVSLHDGTAWGPWSEPASTETGLLSSEDWSAQFIRASAEDDVVTQDAQGRVQRRPPRLSQVFTVTGEPVRARLYISARGVVEAEVNGTRVGDEELTPGWTSYHHRLRYATFDVTEELRPGRNTLGLWLGDGWWRGHLGFGGGATNIYGDTLSAIAQLEITDRRGSTTVISTDDTWTASQGPILRSGLYAGEVFDARLHDTDWAGDETEGSAGAARILPIGATELVAPTGPPVRAVEDLQPQTILNRGDGRWLIDFGQNHSGRLRLHAHGPSGTTIRLRHAEVLQDGELAIEPLRDAAATDALILCDQPIVWEPRFTIHGYRYAEISGWPGELRSTDIVSRVIHSDLERRGWFATSDPVINRLHENIVWSLKSNFVDIPTDCPQRDERLGWTGDLQVFAPTASFLYDVSGFLTSWFRDLAIEQAELAWMPPWVPYFPLEPFSSLSKDPSAVWGDVALLTPAVLYERTGDAGILHAQYDSAVAWLEHVERAAGRDRICRDSEQLGDWLDPGAPPENPFEATTDKYLVATAYFAHSARALAAIAETLGRNADEARWTALADEVADAYARRYVRSDGRVQDDTQTAYALTTVFDLWPNAETRSRGTARLAELVRNSGGRIATGFAGTPLVTDALTSSGHLDEAYLLLECTQCPSWLYTVLSGGTTTWERWDSMRPDGTLNAASMTSFNHYALGAIGDWMHRVVAGIAPAAPGYRRIRFSPRPGGSLTSASATHETPYGRAAIAWELQDERFSVTVDVPFGTTGEVHLPQGRIISVGPGTHHFDEEAIAHHQEGEISDALR